MGLLLLQAAQAALSWQGNRNLGFSRISPGDLIVELALFLI